VHGGRPNGQLLRLADFVVIVRVSMGEPLTVPPSLK
jgi:hypothetical protein